jgi:single-strand DNA-binding protein
MTQENQITLRGYVTTEPKFYQRTLQSVPFTDLRVGSTPRRLNRTTGEWEDGPTTYYRVKCWRRVAINAACSLRKGDKVIIRGQLQVSTWVDNEQRPRTTVEVDADTVGHDLEYGWSIFTRSLKGATERLGIDTGEATRQDIGADYGADAAPALAAAGWNGQAEGTGGGDSLTGDGDSLTGGLDALEREAVPF